jgi:ankyrin repeat protein
LFERSPSAGKVRELVSANANLVNARNPQLQSAVLMSCYQGRKEIRDLLIKKDATLELHARRRHVRKLPPMRTPEIHPANSFSPGRVGFHEAVAVGNLNRVKELAICKAKARRSMLSRQNATGYSALTGAVANGHALIAQWAENGANVNYRYAKGYSPLLTAAANGHLEIVKMLLAHGADLRARTDDGKRALTFAQERGDNQVAKYLQELGLTS